MQFKIPFANPRRQYQDLREEYLRTLDDVLGRGDLIMRGDLERFEQRIAEFVGVKYALGVNSGTDALSLSFEIAGLKPGDEVITAAHTFMASISSIAHQGATPVLIDVGEDFNMDPDLIEAAITPRTKAIEPVHLNGRLADMERIMEIAKHHDLLVIEDAAQALGASIRLRDGSFRRAGSFGLTGCFSLYPFKMLGCFGDGGIVTTNDAEIARKVALYRYNGEDRQTRQFHYHGYTCLLDNVQAAVLNTKLDHFEQWIQRRREIAERYHSGLCSVQQIKIPRFPDSQRVDVFQNYVIRAERRDDLKHFLADSGVETMISWDTPNYMQPVMQPNSIYLPETEKICKEVLSLPMFPELRNDEVDHIVDAVRGFYTA